MITNSPILATEANSQNDHEAIWLFVLLMAEKLERGVISPSDAAIDLVEVTRNARHAARQTGGRDE